ncbi:class I SAM-dependent methyltransferase, partial [Planctomycetota bacterium]
IKVIKLLGLPKAVRMKRHHDQGLKYVRGYAACCCWWTLLNEGILDKLEKEGQVDESELLQTYQGDTEVLEAIVEYLDGIGLLEYQNNRIGLSKDGQVLMAEPRGLLELLWAYEPCFSNLGELLSGKKMYGRDLERRITFVGQGSGRLCEQLPYPVMRRMILEQNSNMVLDLGCGDMALLAGLCRVNEEIRGHGIDNSPEMVRFNHDQLKQNDYDGRLTIQQGDMFALGELPKELPPIDCITACDTFHEYLQDQQRLIELLRHLKERFKGVHFVIGEFCLQDAGWLKKHKTATLEHHLFHQLSNQQIGSAQQWREIFHQAGLEIVEEQIYDIIGHGYFALK